MIIPTKITFDGKNIRKDKVSLGLQAIQLDEYFSINDNSFYGYGCIGCRSVIATTTGNLEFSVVVEVADNVILELRDVLENGDVLYTKSTKNNICIYSLQKGKLHSTALNSIGFEKIGAYYKIIHEYFDKNSKEIIYFDNQFNFIEKCECNIYENDIISNKLKDYELSIIDHSSKINNAFYEFTKRFESQISIHAPTIEQMESGYSNKNVLFVSCNPQSKDYELIKFTDNKIEWRMSLNGISFNDNISIVNDNCFVLIALSKTHTKWRVLKVNNYGKLLDSFDFAGINAVSTKFKNKFIVLYDDYANFSCEQKELFKEQKISIGATIGLVFE